MCLLFLYLRLTMQNIMYSEILCPTKDLTVACGYNYHVHLFCKYTLRYSASFSVSGLSYLLILPVSAASLCLHCVSAQPSPSAERITVSGDVSYLRAQRKTHDKKLDRISFIHASVSTHSGGILRHETCSHRWWKHAQK